MIQPQLIRRRSIHERSLSCHGALFLVLWGSPDGLERSTKRTVLHEHFLGTSSVADLNRDGWLDLVLEPFGPEHSGEKEKLFVDYGGTDGSVSAAGRRVALELDGHTLVFDRALGAEEIQTRANAWGRCEIDTRAVS